MSSDRDQVAMPSDTYEQLRTQHQDSERRLAELSKKAWLTPDEELEEKRLKKIKLRLKDQMANLQRSVS